MGPDPRARQVLFKMLNSGFLGEINGCVSTGKEANVYHATGAGGADLAVKVYKTSILAFKDRDRRARPRRAGPQERLGGVVGSRGRGTASASEQEGVCTRRERQLYIISRVAVFK